MKNDKPVRTKGITQGAADLDRNDVMFTLDTERGPIHMVANLGAVQQLLAALAPMAAAVRENVGKSGASYSTAAQKVAEASIHAERYANLVLMQLVTTHGVPHIFALEPDNADKIAGALKTQSAQARLAKPGRA